MELKLTLERRYKCNDYTIGRMKVGSVVTSDTLEDKDRGLTSDMSLAAIKLRKIFGKTAIPTGTYRVKLTYSPKFASKPWAKKYGGLVPEILDVKGFSGVRIHPLNNASETEGCVGVGENKVKGQIINSVSTYCSLMNEYLIPAHRRNDVIWITVK
jgi:hypothetical protein